MIAFFALYVMASVPPLVVLKRLAESLSLSSKAKEEATGLFWGDVTPFPLQALLDEKLVKFTKVRLEQFSTVWSGLGQLAGRRLNRSKMPSV